jgi:hypothetical protein
MPSQRSPRASGDGHGGRPRSSIFHPNLCSSSLPHHATSQLLVWRPCLPCDQTQAGPQLSFSASPPPLSKSAGQRRFHPPFTLSTKFPPPYGSPSVGRRSAILPGQVPSTLSLVSPVFPHRCSFAKVVCSSAPLPAVMQGRKVSFRFGSSVAFFEPSSPFGLVVALG